MANLNLDYYNNDSGYSDGDVEQDLLEAVRSGRDLEKVTAQDGRWPVYYHLSPRRENILNWYPFKPGSDILEIGSGCGALTGMLSDRAGRLASVELTKERADVNYARNKDKENLEIYVGNFNNMDFGRKFDYIILNGVLEYALSFTDSDTPFEDFLENVRSHLKDDGVILIAIENRLGLKYFNGVPEDHTAQLFSGLDGYPHTTNVRTFSKKELSDLLERSGLGEYKFFYPNPDYKFPQVIYTDDSMEIVDNRVETDTFNTNRVRFFNESEVLRSLLEEGIADRFFNSFLVEASAAPRPKQQEEIIFSKISDRRRPEYRLRTVITKDADSKKRVYKEALDERGQGHIERMKLYYEENPESGRFTNAPLYETDRGVSFDYIEGPTLKDKLLELLRKGEYGRFEEEIKGFAGELLEGACESDDYADERFTEMFGEARAPVPLNVKSGANFDMLFTNVIDNGEAEYVIDYEWIFDMPIPQEFVVWRSLFYLSDSDDLKRSGYDIGRLMEVAGIDPALHETFAAWDEHFGNDYISDRDDALYKNQTIDAVPFLTEMIGINNKISSIYIDFGDGFKEEYRLATPLKIDHDTFEAEFDLRPLLKDAPGRIHAIRWDPVEQACRLKDVEVETVGGDIGVYLDAFTSVHKSMIDGWLVFFDNDPQLDLLGDYEGLEEIKVSGKILYINTIEALEAAERMRAISHSQQERIDQLSEEVEDKDLHIRNLESSLELPPTL